MEQVINQGQPINQPPVTDQSAAIPTTLPPKKNNSCLIILIVVLIFLFLVGLVIAGYFIIKKNSVKKWVEPPFTIITPTPTILPEPSGVIQETITPKPTETSNNTLNWKTYSQTIFFKYPENVALTEGQQGDSTISLSLFGPSQKKDTEAYDGLFLTFYLPQKLNGQSFETYVNEQFSQEQKNLEIIGGTMDKGLEKTEIAGLKGYTYTLTGLGTHHYFYLLSPDLNEVIKITNSTVDPTNQGFEQTVEQILASFKFLP